MKIKSLSLRDFRGIQALDLTFSNEQIEPVVVIFGINGVGKTAILDAIALAMTSFTTEILAEHKHLKNRYWEKQHRDWNAAVKQAMRNNATVLTIELTVTHGGVDYSWATHYETGDSRPKIQNRESLRSLVASLEPQTSLPICVLYATNRSVLDIPERIRTEHDFDAPFSAMESALEANSSDFRLFFEWFRNREDLENEQFRFNRKDFEDRQLKAVRTAIKGLMTGFDAVHISRRPPMAMMLKKNGEALSVNQLSDGEKCLLAMVGDMARRLAIAYPEMEQPLDGEAIFLIDEIELHLHPVWQRDIIPCLRKTFPNAQLILTSHSPQVLGGVSNEGVFKLAREQGEIQIVSAEVYGRDSNQILLNEMDGKARDELVESDINRLFDMIMSRQIPCAKELLQTLREKIGTHDPELVRAEALLTRLELIGK